MKKTITKKFTFESAHSLYDDLSEEDNKKIFGKCVNVHGHSYKLFISVSGKEKNGMIINFTELKQIVNENIIEKFDHKYLNDTMPILTTCENMVDVFWGILDVRLMEKNIQLEKIKLYETENSYCELMR